jgi:hypothetical protein
MVLRAPLEGGTRSQAGKAAIRASRLPLLPINR